MNACELLVTLMYVIAAATAMFSIHIRCKATVEDIERHCLKQGKASWYMFRIVSVVVLLGGAMHARQLVAMITGSLFFRGPKR